MNFFEPQWNGWVSWWFILPVCMIGLISSGISIVDLFIISKKHKSLNLILSVPFLLLMIYFFIIK